MSTARSGRSRRGRDEGSVYQRADGRWVAQVSLGVVGGRRRKREAVCASKRAALEKLRELQVRHLGATHLPASSRTVRDLSVEWLDHVKATRAPNTYRIAAGAMRRVVVPLLGHVPLRDLTPPIVRDAFATLRGLGSSPKAEAFEILGRALNYAVERGMIDTNPCKSLTRPKHKPREMEIWTTEQIAQFLARAQHHPRFAAAVLAMLCGLRAGEVLGLRWGDIDMRGRTLAVRRQKTLDGIDDPKSASSRRVVPLPETAVAALRAHRERMTAIHDELPDTVFAGLHGGPIAANSLRRDWLDMIELAGLPPRRFHELRHSAGSLLIAQGNDAKTVSEIMGHSSPAITLAIYTHSSPRQHAAAAASIDEALRSTSGLPVRTRGPRPPRASQKTKSSRAGRRP